MDISIIIVNYNGGTCLNDCLNSIFENPTRAKFEVILVDNNSTDNSIANLGAYQDKITLIQNPDNRGFAAANNQAIKTASGNYLFLLNNDTILLDNALDKIMAFHDAHPDIGGLSPKLLNPDGSIQTQGSSLTKFRYHAKRPTKVPFVAFAAFFILKSRYDTLGGLDENFFFYNDDVDFCRRIRLAGFPIYYLPSAQVIHTGGVATKTIKAASMIEGLRGGLYLCQKHYHPIIYTIYRRILLLYCKGGAFFLTRIIRWFPEKRELLEALRAVARIIRTNDIYRNPSKVR